jgi:hypothetical protein
MSDLDLPLLAGGGVLAAYLWSRSRDRETTVDPPIDPPDVPQSPRPPESHGPASTSTQTQSTPPPAPPAPPFRRPLPGRWVWPVQVWRGRKPVISDGFGSPRPGGRTHEGVDIMYARAPGDSFRVGSPNGAAHHVMPDDTLALAASDGVVWSASWTPRGFTVVIDHTPLAPVATYYTHLARLLVSPTARAASGQRVRAGQPIGVVGADPLDAEHLKHLHFAVDPEPLMYGWEYVADPQKPSTSALLALRNAALTYRDVGDVGEPYPEWVRALRGKSGVYVIRDASSREVLYVGMSETNLYDTMTRHLQRWNRWKGYWREQYSRRGQRHDPGTTYARPRVEIAVRLTARDRATDEEARLIRKLAPRDNLIGQAVEDESIPF